MLKNNPFVSIIVPLYNYRKFIKDCIISILNQTYYNFELIVVDDNSTDNSYKTAKKFEIKDKRVKVIKLNKNYGYSKAKNEGILISKGQYIVTLDADDMMTTNSIKIRLKAILKHNVSFVYADAITVNGYTGLKSCYQLNIEQIKKQRQKKVVYSPSINIYNIHAQTAMIHRDIYKKYGLYDESLRSKSDREMWWRLFGKDKSERPKISFYYIHKAVAYYRYHRNSMWRKRKRNKKYDDIIAKKAKQAYEIRKRQGITIKNTRFLMK